MVYPKVLFPPNFIIKVQGSQREGRPGCGPGSVAAKAFPKVIAAGLTRLIAAVMVSQEGVDKASKAGSPSPRCQNSEVFWSTLSTTP